METTDRDTGRHNIADGAPENQRSQFSWCLQWEGNIIYAAELNESLPCVVYGLYLIKYTYAVTPH